MNQTTTPPQDERRGLPSGSSALYDSLCPGRWRLQKQFNAMTDEPLPPEFDVESLAEDLSDVDRDAEAGKRIHTLYAGQECPEASEAERRRAEMALQIDAKMKQEWLKAFEIEPELPIVEIREKRWWLNNDAGQPIYSGQSDAVWLRGEFGSHADILVGDLKGLYGYHDAAPLNVQIRRYIALIAVNIEELGFTRLRSAMAYLNQPAKTMNPVPVEFNEEDVKAAVAEMHDDLAKMMAENAPRVSGPVQCSKCIGKMICTEFLEALPTLPVVIPQTGPVLTDEQIEEKVAKLDGPQISSLLDWLPSLDHLIGIARTEAKRRLRIDPGSIPDWGLKPNSPREKVVDLKTLWVRLSDQMKVESDEFIKLCSITKGNVQTLVKEKTGLKGKGLDERVKVLLEGTTMPTPVSPSLERKS